MAGEKYRWTDATPATRLSPPSPARRVGRLKSLLRKLNTWLLPEAALVAGAIVFLRLADRATVAGFAQFYPYAVFGAGLLLAWRFQRSRLLFSVLLLAIASYALLKTAGVGVRGGVAWRMTYLSIAVLLPLDLAGLALLGERGTLTRGGALRFAAIAAQVALVVMLGQREPARTAAVLGQKLLPAVLFTWTPLSQLALAAFAGAVALLVFRLLFQDARIARTALWVFVPLFLALQAPRNTATVPIYLATAALVAVVAVIEANYFMAYQDTLTGLPARRALNEALLKVGETYAVAMADVDRFKQFNDNYGHDIGDHVLRMVAAKLGQVGGGAKAFRYGGEEFALLFPGKSAEEAVPFLQEVRKAVEEASFTIRGRGRPRKKPDSPRTTRSTRRAVTITISIGVAEHNGRQHTPDLVVKAADRALYRAKDEGRNRVCT